MRSPRGFGRDTSRAYQLCEGPRRRDFCRCGRCRGPARKYREFRRFSGPCGAWRQVCSRPTAGGRPRRATAATFRRWQAAPRARGARRGRERSPPPSAARGRRRQRHPRARGRTAGRCRRDHGPMPGTAVSASCTASSGACASFSRSSPSSMAALDRTQRAHLAARQAGAAQAPHRSSAQEGARRHRADGDLPGASRSPPRSQSTVADRRRCGPAPRSRAACRRSGGSPVRSCTRRRCAHLRRNARTPSRISASVSMVRELLALVRRFMCASCVGTFVSWRRE